MTPRPTPALRRLSIGAATLALGATTVGLIPGSASAFSGSVCDPAPQNDTSFCVLNSATFDDASNTPTTLANEKVGLDLEWTNYSTGLSADKDRWLASVGFTSGDATTDGPHITDGTTLDNNLLVAGFPMNADDCTAGAGNSFSACTAGNGTAYIEVTDGLGGKTVRNATVGVHRIVSVTPSDPSILADYEVTLEIYSPAASLIDPITIDATTHLIVYADTGSGVTATMPVEGTANGSLGSTYDWSLRAIHLNFKHASATLANGSAASQTFTVAQLADTCIPQTFTTSATSRAATVLSVTSDFETTDCPTTPTGLTAWGQLPFLGVFSAAASIEGGRPLASQPYLWDFGDGTTSQTTGATTSHDYGDAAPHDITLTAVDSGGAKSDTVQVHLDGAKITFGPALLTATYGQGAAISGTLVDYVTDHGLGGKTISVYTCDPGSIKRSLAGASSTTAQGDFAFNIYAQAPGLFCANYNGSTGRLGVESLPIQVQVRFGVSLKASKSTVARGATVRLFGTVGPDSAGETVLIQRRIGGAWKTIATKTLSAKSAYSLQVTLTGKATSAKFRVVKKGAGDYLRGVSKPRTVKITRS